MRSDKAPRATGIVHSQGDGGGDDVTPTTVRGVTVHRLPLLIDSRGSLSPGEFVEQIPFAPQRYFIVFDVPGQGMRGAHAHRACHQFLLCARGSLTAVVDDGTTSEAIVLDVPNVGLYLPPMVWAVMHRHSADALLLAFASHHYDPADYINDYDEFRTAARR